MVCRAGRRGSLEVDGYTSSEEESGGLLTGLNTSGNLYIGTTFIHFRCLRLFNDIRHDTTSVPYGKGLGEGVA